MQVSTEGEPTAVNTIAKSIAPTAEVSPVASARTSSSGEYLVGGIKRHKTGRLVILSLLAVATLTAAFGAYKFLNRNVNRPAATSSQMKVSRLTSTGKVKRAAISPEGKFIACSYREDINAPWRFAIIPSGGGKPVKDLRNVQVGFAQRPSI